MYNNWYVIVLLYWFLFLFSEKILNLFVSNCLCSSQIRVFLTPCLHFFFPLACTTNCSWSPWDTLGLSFPYIRTLVTTAWFSVLPTILFFLALAWSVSCLFLRGMWLRRGLSRRLTSPWVRVVGWHRVEPLCWSFPSDIWLGNFLILSSSVKLGPLEGGGPCLIFCFLFPSL